jgi:sterol 3beta-glucosyltransferase
MRALLLTLGSQGDVQPFVALARRLRDEGHEAVLAAPAIYQSLAASATASASATGPGTGDITFVPLDLDMVAVGEAVAGKHGLRHAAAFAKSMGQRAKAILPALTAAAGGPGTADGPGRPDVVVHHPVLPIGQHLADLLGVPAAVAPPLPALVPTREFLSPAWPFRRKFPKALNRPSYRAARLLAGAWCRGDLDAWRRDTLHLASRPGRHDPLRYATGGQVTVLHSFSEHVVPRPPDWPANAHITGYWFLPADPGWTPPRRLAEFLDAGEPPVYLGFGSMPADDPGKLADAIETAASLTGARFIVSSLSPELRRRLTSGRMLVIRNAPHDWLFPRTAAVVHHGGAGTTGAAVVAGRPQVIWPFGIDQHFWSDRMVRRGVAVPAAPVSAMTGTRLARAVDQATNDQLIADLATQLARRVQVEDGTGQAVTQLTRLAGSETAGTIETAETTKAAVPA